MTAQLDSQDEDQDPRTATVVHCVQKKTPIHVFFYISVENFSICTKFSGYVCEELGIPSKSKLNIHCTEIFIVYRGSVKRIIHKHVKLNVTSELHHR